MQPREYKVSYMVHSNKFTFDGVNVTVTMGPLRKRTFPFNSIQNYYVFENGPYRSLWVTYLNEKGKLKKAQLFADIGDVGFRELVNDLNSSIGGKSLNHLPEKEAFKVMKQANPKKMGMLVAAILFIGISTAAMYPGLRHFFDFGFEYAEVQDLIRGEDFGTRNLELSGIPLDVAVEEYYTSTGGRSSSEVNTKTFIPLVPPDWDYDRPIMVVMQFDYVTESEFDAILEHSTFTGVVRDIGYEGLDSDEREYFMTEYGLEVPEDAILFEVTGAQHNDSHMIWIWIGVNGFLVIISAIVYYKQMKG